MFARTTTCIDHRDMRTAIGQFGGYGKTRNTCTEYGKIRHIRATCDENDAPAHGHDRRPDHQRR